MGNHDSAYRLLFSYPYLVEALVRGFVPGDWVDALDFATLETAREAHPDDAGTTRYGDMIWRLRWRKSGGWVYVYLMLEFQSKDEPFMAVRALDYDAGVYRQIVRTLQPRRGDRLPIVLPVVLYRGQPAWSSPTEMFELIEPAPAEIEPYLPHLRFLLLDASAYPADQLEAMRNPVACILELEASRTLETRPIEILDEILSAPEHAGLRRALTQWLTRVLLPSRIPGATVPEVEKLEEVSPMITDNAIDWTIPWKEDGRREGRREGEIAVLTRLLTRKFGALDAETRGRLKAAGDEQLLEWSERLLTATELSDVFDGQ